MAKNFTPHRIAFYIGIVVVWQVVAMAGIWPDNIFPSPYEVAEDLFLRGLCLPSGSNLQLGDLERIEKVLNTFFSKSK